jgi:hypothetical protein
LVSAFLVWILPAAPFPDFICYWTAGKLLASGASPYDPALQAQVQQEHGWDRQRDGFGEYDYLPFYYPPWFGLLFVPLVPLGFAGARTAWYFLNVEFVLLAGYYLSRALPGASPLWRRLALVVSPLFLFTVAGVLLGQTSPFVFFVLVLSWYLLSKKVPVPFFDSDVAAGATLAWLSVKPQLTALLVLALLVWLMRRRRWRAVGAFFLTCAVLAGGSALIVPTWPLQMWHAIRDTPSPTEFFPWIGNAWLLVLRSLGLRGPLLVAAYLVLALPFLAAVARSAWRLDSRLEDLVSLATLAAFFVAPYARHYDFPVLLIPLFVAAPRLPRPAALALVAVLVCAPYVQHFLLVRYHEQHPSSVKFLVEYTYFWVPVLLATVWAWTARRQQS